MKNKYHLPEDKLEKIKERDKKCVYCRKKMIDPVSGGSRRDWATIEHLNHLPPWDDPSTVAICCWSCNSSRGNKKLLDWFETPYCIKNKISYDAVERVVRDYIKNHEKLYK